VSSNARLGRPRSITRNPGASCTTPGALELFADPARMLAIADPSGRQLHISCGAVLHAATLLLRAEVGPVRLRLLPDPARPDLFAWIETELDQASPHPSPPIELGRQRPATRSCWPPCRAATCSVARFEPRRLPQSLLVSLAHAAAAEGLRASLRRAAWGAPERRPPGRARRPATGARPRVPGGAVGLEPLRRRGQ